MSKKKYIIYKITNLLNDKYYIGKHSTTTPYNMKKYWGSSDWLKSSIKKHGKKNFKRETLFVFDIEEEAFQKEAELMPIELANSDKVYNFRAGGRGGFTCSEETKKRNSESHKNKVFSEETRKKMSEAHKGEKHPMFGKHHSEESKKKISETKSGKIGKPHTKETRKKMSENQWKRLSSKVIKQRRRDIVTIRKIKGYQKKLAGQWNADPSTVSKFIKSYASDLIQNLKGMK